MESADLPQFADANLARALCEALGETPTRSALAALTGLSADGRGIYGLWGLEAAVGLTCLSLAENEVEDLTPLAGLTRLEVLRLHDNRCGDLRPLSGLLRLRTLTLGGFWVDEDVGTLTLEAYGPIWGPAIVEIEPLRGLVEMQELRIIHHRLKSIAALAGMRRLAALDLDGHRGGGPVADWTPLRALEGLRTLSLRSNGLTDDVLGVVAGLPPLERLDLCHNVISEVDALVEGRCLIAGSCVDLRGNPLSERAQNVEIPRLRARGVHVVAESV